MLESPDTAPDVANTAKAAATTFGAQTPDVADRSKDQSTTFGAAPLQRKRLGKHERELLLLAAPNDTDFLPWETHDYNGKPWHGGRFDHRVDLHAERAGRLLPGLLPEAESITQRSAQHRAIRTLSRAGLVVKRSANIAIERVDGHLMYSCRAQLTRTPLGDQVVAALGDTLKTNKRIRWAAALSTTEGR
jgi:hypothetical protein